MAAKGLFSPVDPHPKEQTEQQKRAEDLRVKAIKEAFDL
jgi:hypothetical protein